MTPGYRLVMAPPPVADYLRPVREVAPPGAWVTLFADPPGRRLYARHGFIETAPASVGMGVVLGA